MIIQARRRSLRSGRLSLLTEKSQAHAFIAILSRYVSGLRPVRSPQAGGGTRRPLTAAVASGAPGGCSDSRRERQYRLKGASSERW